MTFFFKEKGSFLQRESTELINVHDLRRNEYTDWDRPSALDDLSMRDSLSLALSDALVVAPLMHVVHLHAQRSTNPSGTFFYHYQGQILASVIQTQLTSSHDTQDVDLSEYHVSSVTIDFQTILSFDGIFYGGMHKLRSRYDEDVVVD